MSGDDKISDRTFSYCAYNEGLREFTGSPWERLGGWSLADVRKKSGQDLVENPGLPQMVFLPSEIKAAELRAEMTKAKIEDVVVTVVFHITFKMSTGCYVQVESVPFKKMYDRISELKARFKQQLCIPIAYSEETHQIFIWNNEALEDEPRLPGYNEQTKRKSNQVSRKELKELAQEVST